MVIEDKVYELKAKFNVNKMFDGYKSLPSLLEFYKLNTININTMLELLRKYYELFFLKIIMLINSLLII